MQYAAPPPLPPSRRPPTLDETDAKPRSGIRWYWIAIPSVLLVLICGVGGVKIYSGFVNIQESLDQPSRQFLRLYQQDELTKAYKTLGSTQLKSEVPLEKFGEPFVLIKTVMGKLKSFKPGPFHSRVNIGSDSVGMIQYNAEFENGPGTIKMTLHQNDGVWKVTGINVDSPRFMEFMTEKAIEKRDDETESDDSIVSE